MILSWNLSKLNLFNLFSRYFSVVILILEGICKKRFFLNQSLFQIEIIFSLAVGFILLHVTLYKATKLTGCEYCTKMQRNFISPSSLYLRLRSVYRVPRNHREMHIQSIPMCQYRSIFFSESSFAVLLKYLHYFNWRNLMYSLNCQLQYNCWPKLMTREQGRAVATIMPILSRMKPLKKL